MKESMYKLVVLLFLLFNFSFISLGISEEGVLNQSQEDSNTQKMTLITSIETIITNLDWNGWSTRDIVSQIGRLDYIYDTHSADVLSNECYFTEIFTEDDSVHNYLQKLPLEKLQYVNELLVKHLKIHAIKKYIDKLEFYRDGIIPEMLSEGNDPDLSYDLPSQFNTVSHATEFLEEELHDLSIKEGGGLCSGDEDCEDLCDNLFSSGSNDYQEWFGSDLEGSTRNVECF